MRPLTRKQGGPRKMPRPKTYTGQKNPRWQRRETTSGGKRSFGHPGTIAHPPNPSKKGGFRLLDFDAMRQLAVGQWPKGRLHGRKKARPVRATLPGRGSEFCGRLARIISKNGTLLWGVRPTPLAHSGDCSSAQHPTNRRWPEVRRAGPII